MILKRAVVQVMIVALSAACSNECERQHRAATPGEQHLLDHPTLEKLQAKAEGGDMVAVKRLILHYELAAPDLRKAMHWQRVTANHGDAGAMLNLSTYLAMRGKQESCSEAVEWIERARLSSTNAGIVARAERKLSQIQNDGPCAKWLQSPH